VQRVIAGRCCSRTGNAAPRFASACQCDISLSIVWGPPGYVNLDICTFNHGNNTDSGCKTCYKPAAPRLDASVAEVVGMEGICPDAGKACSGPGSVPISGMGMVCDTPPFMTPFEKADVPFAGAAVLPGGSLLSGVLGTPGNGSDSAGGRTPASPVSMRAIWPAMHLEEGALSRSVRPTAPLSFGPMRMTALNTFKVQGSGAGQ
jgi:hypothetical protein